MTKKTKMVLAGLLAVATLATFIVPNTAIVGFFEPFSLLRFILMVSLLALVFNLVPGIPKLDKEIGGLRYKKWTNRLVLVLPIFAIVFALINAILPELGSALVHGSENIPFRPAIFVKLAFDLVSCIIFVIIALRLAKRKNWPFVIIVMLLALVAFWMAMEEISWGQRIFKWETTGYFAANNMQGETNLHNLNTQLFQNTLYFGGFLLLVVLPFFRDSITKFLHKTKRLKPITALLPGAWMISAFAAGMGFTDPYISDAGWHWGSICFTLAGTTAILTVYAIRARQKSDPRFKEVLSALIAFLVAVSLSLALPGVWNQNSGSPTEYLELFIALGIMSWAIDLYVRSKDNQFLRIS